MCKFSQYMPYTSVHMRKFNFLLNTRQSTFLSQYATTRICAKERGSKIVFFMWVFEDHAVASSLSCEICGKFLAHGYSLLSGPCLY